ncbi:MAG: radical SAM protein [Deltaproteobacteria bacterium]|nr:radical SAM protein [Deltaproteobacteria bacterium]
MQYDMPLYRPPSEANSLIFQITLGCSWNRCLFCGMYKSKRYQVRKWEEIEKDVLEMAWLQPDTRRIFLADGDALGVETPFLIRILELLNEKFRSLERVGIYAGPTNFKDKTISNLKALRKRKLDMLYLGIETGNDDLLKRICKGAGSAEIIEAGRKALDAGLRLSTIILLGLGGVDGSFVHAKDSAKVVNAINPSFLSCLTLMLGHFSEVYETKIMGDGFKLLDKRQSLQELRWFVEDLELKGTHFGTEHASNYLPIHGDFPQDKQKILKLIDMALGDKKSGLLRPEWARGL